MSEELTEVLEQLREIRADSKDVRERVIILGEQVKNIGDHEERIRRLEAWRWVTTSSLLVGFTSLLGSFFEVKPG